MVDVVRLILRATMERAIVIVGMIVSLENVAAQIAINPNSHPLTALMTAVVSYLTCCTADYSITLYIIYT